MSIRIVCPSCDKAYNLDDSMHGKTVLCRECNRPFSVSAAPALPRREDDRRSREERNAPASRPASSEGRYRRDDDDDRRSRPVERSRERDQEWDDEPRRDRRPERPRRGEDAGNKNLMPVLLGVGAAAVVLIALGIGTLVFAFRSPSPRRVQVASASEPAFAPFGDAGQAAGGAAPAERWPAGGDEAAPAVPAGPVPSEMAASTVQQVKKSTVQLRVQFSGSGAEGSGFFAVQRGIVITNAHVIGMIRPGTAPPRSVEVVINSGEADEVRTSGTVLGVDRENDLAVLRVNGDLSRLPPALPIDTATKLTETQKVYIFGFPFGSKLGKNITVSTSSVSSLRRENGILKQVQVNGGMHPGNSGGPVTDARGAVIGVSVAGISGTTINFAIPADFIQQVVNRAKASPLDPNAPGPGQMPGGFAPPAGGFPRPPMGPGWPGGPGRPMGPGRPAGPPRGPSF
jgi:S1-C subfamily serine protease